MKNKIDPLAKEIKKNIRDGNAIIRGVRVERNEKRKSVMQNLWLLNARETHKMIVEHAEKFTNERNTNSIRL
jgi:hypothetical protein